jgi:hypothetical protein
MIRNSTASRLLGVIGLASVASALSALIVLEISPTGLSSVTSAVSQWALTPSAWGYRWFTISLAIAGIAMAIQLWGWLQRRRVGIAISLTLFALGRSVVGWVNMDAPGAAATPRGDVHWLLGFVSFVSMIVAMFLTASATRGRKRRGWVSIFCLILSVFTLSAIALFFGSVGMSALASFLGVFERAFYVASMLWMAVMFVAVLAQRRSRS